ncbi:MAG: nitrilase-related carbon-nitrogen hydrolase [Asgard group archaeon]|nr:nitrilase-related carbon-nitrogen hydrolase [Asgard group archaeon]
MKVGFIQFAPNFGNKKENVQKSIKLIKKGAEADLLVLPELCNTGYLFVDKSEVNRLAETIPDGKSTKAWERIAKETNTFLVAGICERTENGAFYNSAVLIGPDGYIDTYRKIHLFDTEKKFFQAGKGPLKIYDILDTKIGIIICFDWIFPEISRILALHGAEIICHPANLVLPYAQHAMLTRSIENKVFTITANRIGVDDRPKSKLEFTGMSQITSPKMTALEKAERDIEEVRIIDIDPSIAKDKMITNKNHIFLDRKSELYKPLLNEYPLKE